IFAVAVIVIRIVHSHSQPPSAQRVTRSEYDWHAILLLFCTCASALFVALFAVRPDLDDASFLQIALQTLAYPDKAPFSFDASLGEVIEQFRFAPYRFTSYEILVAFLSELIGISAGAAYYILLPGISATLSVL